ncbi:hypothetical protein [Nostoc sp. 'Peltigera malacea cyanobiont' DB3992]|uniref:hypothetical protein n=1 Tax=Nostoc sp. 'Peltigera malacea cyanobiont' DB3992 TaxID=1206980 RepID=UPI00118074A2|nr:hypothetical protein [Nostoc sp. 'Peltigera malacea cyanobiont' DB3992]
MSIAWRGQHQFSLITAVSQPGRETGRGASQFLFCTERITVIAIAQRAADKQLHGLVLSWRFCDCFASLAMTYKKVGCS